MQDTAGASVGHQFLDLILITISGSVLRDEVEFQLGTNPGGTSPWRDFNLTMDSIGFENNVLDYGALPIYSARLSSWYEKKSIVHSARLSCSRMGTNL